MISMLTTRRFHAAVTIELIAPTTTGTDLEIFWRIMAPRFRSALAAGVILNGIWM